VTPGKSRLLLPCGAGVTHVARKSNHHRRSENTSTRERVYQHIQRQISSGDLRAGDTVSELSVAEKLGVSRTPVREAIGQLAAEGILEQSRNRRAVVTKLTRQDIIDLYELREALEVYVAGKAARRHLDRTDLDRLQALADTVLVLKDELQKSGKPELDAEQMLRFAAYDLGFHLHLMRLAANGRILKLVNDTRLLIRIFTIRRHGHTVPLLTDIHRRHSEIVRAIIEHDPESAKRAMADHIQLSQRERLDDFDHWEIEASLGQAIPRSIPARSLLSVSSLRDSGHTG
jgi:DNA-binding GntR family transcriptional regulator